MSKLAELLVQKAKLEKEIEDAEAAAKHDGIKEIVDLANRYGISYAELKPHMTKRRKRRTKAEIAAG